MFTAKSKRKKTAVIPVDDEAHLSIREQPPPQEGVATPTVPVLGQSDQVSLAKPALYNRKPCI